MERKHEGIVRFKCHVMNCTFGSSQHKDLRRHAKTHKKESLKIELNDKTHEKESLTCDQEECNVKVSRDAWTTNQIQCGELQFWTHILRETNENVQSDKWDNFAMERESGKLAFTFNIWLRINSSCYIYIVSFKCSLKNAFL